MPRPQCLCQQPLRPATPSLALERGAAMGDCRTVTCISDWSSESSSNISHLIVTDAERAARGHGEERERGILLGES